VLAGLFCVSIGPFGMLIDLVCVLNDLFYAVGLFCAFTGVFCVWVGLFCVRIGLFCVMGRFCVSRDLSVALVGLC